VILRKYFDLFCASGFGFLARLPLSFSFRRHDAGSWFALLRLEVGRCYFCGILFISASPGLHFGIFGDLWLESCVALACLPTIAKPLRFL